MICRVASQLKIILARPFCRVFKFLVVIDLNIAHFFYVSQGLVNMKQLLASAVPIFFPKDQ